MVVDKGLSGFTLGKLGTPAAHIAWLKKFNEPVNLAQAYYNPEIETMYIYKK